MDLQGKKGGCQHLLHRTEFFSPAPCLPSRSQEKQYTGEPFASTIFCGHVMHLSCFVHYITTLELRRAEQDEYDDDVLFIDRASRSFPCPLCRRPVNTIAPISSAGARPWSLFTASGVVEPLGSLEEFITAIAETTASRPTESPAQGDFVPLVEKMDKKMDRYIHGYKNLERVEVCRCSTSSLPPSRLLVVLHSVTACENRDDHEVPSPFFLRAVIHVAADCSWGQVRKERAIDRY